MSVIPKDDHARQRLYEAMCALGASALPLQERVAHAMYSLHDLPPTAFTGRRDRVIFTALLERFRAVESETEGSILASAEEMSDEQAVAAAKEIVGLAGTYVLDLDRIPPS